jgi:hypothetical protein
LENALLDSFASNPMGTDGGVHAHGVTAIRERKRIDWVV